MLKPSESFEQAVLGNQKEVPEEINELDSEENEAEIQREINRGNQGEIKREIEGEINGGNQGEIQRAIKGEYQEEIQRENQEESPGLKEKLNDAEIEDACTKMATFPAQTGIL